MTDDIKIQKLKQRYGASANGNFYVIDTIPVPHPYCITPKHLQYSHSMYLDIEGAERESKELNPNNPRKWAVCDTCRKINKQNGTPILSYAEHKSALLVECKIEIMDADKKAVPELHEYLLANKDKAVEDKYEGFAFKKAF